MFVLKMKVARVWVDVGHFDTLDEARDCIFDSRYEYRIFELGELVFIQPATATSRRT